MKRSLRWAGWAYLGLLLISHLVGWLRAPVPVPAGMQVAEVPEFRADGSPTGRMIDLAYWDRGARAESGAPVIVLLHGSPVASSFFEPLVAALEEGQRFRLIVPDLPGFGASQERLVDYSVAAHAHELAALLEQLGVGPVHLVGYSMGGGVALEFADAHPDEVASLAMVSSIGVQEYEMFGDYAINHSVHFLQWFVLAAVEWGVPHFGSFTRQPLNLAYARNFLDTDQRRLRPILQRFTRPVLILHGREDGLVPIQAAREHARIVPQAELVELTGGHGMVRFDPEPLANHLRTFVTAVETGAGVDREDASPARLEAARAPFVRDRTWRYTGFAAILVTLVLMASTMLSEDLTCIGAGFLAANGLVSLTLAIVACFLGIFLGDLLLYLAGRHLGRPALGRRPVRWFVSNAAVRRAEAWFHRRGAIIIVASRFLPGTRAATYFTAGVVRAPFWKFFFYFAFAAALWTPLLVTLASRLGRRMLGWYESYEAWALPGLLAGGAGLYLSVEYGLPLFSWRGRRLLLGKWRRLTHWEYWPLWVVNTPTVLYVMYLVFLRYRRPTAFTLSNPGIPHGGFLGESKSQILGQYDRSADFMLPWALCPAGETLLQRRERLAQFQAGLAEPWPIVIKPDEGQRGLAVRVVRDLATAEEVLARTDSPWILQGYCPGEEYGIFYYRMPGAERGEVPSITTKVMTSVTGDGVRTLEDLILSDDRAVDLAPRFLEVFSERLEEVPPAGKRVALVELGTHARGATFLDGRALITPALVDRIEEIARQFEGFNYGRFDIRAPSAEDLQAGRGLKVIELNGLTSEQTHIYAPGASLWAAWSTLLRSWHLAIRIGLEHERQSGLKPWPTIRFLTWWWESFWRQRKLRD